MNGLLEYNRNAVAHHAGRGRNGLRLTLALTHNGRATSTLTFGI